LVPTAEVKVLSGFSVEGRRALKSSRLWSSNNGVDAHRAEARNIERVDTSDTPFVASKTANHMARGWFSRM
jgi:hypothetical protein